MVIESQLLLTLRHEDEIVVQGMFIDIVRKDVSIGGDNLRDVASNMFKARDIKPLCSLKVNKVVFV
jgi:hypothetical protein